MKLRRVSALLAFSAQAAFLAALSFLPWTAAVLAAFGISLAAVILRLGFDRAGFPRLEIGSFLVFSSMAAFSLAVKGEILFPYTGVFFGAGLGSAGLAETAFGIIEVKSIRRPSIAPLLLGCGYSASAALQISFFPRPAYLYLGVGLLAAVSIVDIVRGIAVAALRRRRLSKASLSAAACLVLLFAALPARAESGTDSRDDEALFARLFGEAPPTESPADLVYISEIAIEKPDCFTDAYVMSYARGIEAGMRMKRGELESALRRVGERLELSGMFYQSGASYRVLGTLSSGDIEVRVVLTVSDGFWWGFNFSPWDLSLGYSNLFREGKRLSATAGLNTQGLEYLDPAVSNGRTSYSLGAAHAVSVSGGGIDPAYLNERILASAAFGCRPADDFSFGLDIGYFGIRALSGFFLYPGYAGPPDAEIRGLGISNDLSSFASAGVRASAGDYTYKKRGGIKARANARVTAFLPFAEDFSALWKISLSGDFRVDAPKLLRLAFHEQIEYLPAASEGSGLPEILRARAGGYRGSIEVRSGEFASLSRACLSFDPVARFNLGFTSLSLIPELFYEAAFVRRAPFSADPNPYQDCGFLLKGSFSAPVGRTFGLGIAMDLPVADGPKIKIVFEIE